MVIRLGANETYLTTDDGEERRLGTFDGLEVTSQTGEPRFSCSGSDEYCTIVHGVVSFSPEDDSGGERMLKVVVSY